MASKIVFVGLVLALAWVFASSSAEAAKYNYGKNQQYRGGKQQTKQHRYAAAAGAARKLAEEVEPSSQSAQQQKPQEPLASQQATVSRNVDANEDKWCLVSSGFSAPSASGLPLGLRVKRNIELPPERGLFVVVAIEPGSPSASVLHVGDTITMLKGLPTRDMTLAQFSKHIQDARAEGSGYVSLEFFTKYCPEEKSEPVVDKLAADAAHGDPLETLQKKESEETIDREPAQTREETPQSNQDLKAESTKEDNVEEQNDDDEEEDDEKDDEEEDDNEEENEEEASDDDDDDDNDEDDDNDRIEVSGVFGEFSVELSDFEPPLGLRVTEDGRQLIIVGVTAKPEVWHNVRVGDVLKAVGGREPQTTTELKEAVAAQSGSQKVIVTLRRPLPRAIELPQSGDSSEKRPRMVIKLMHPRNQPLGIRLASLSASASTENGYLGVVDPKNHEYLIQGDRLRSVDGVVVMTPLDVSDTLKFRGGGSSDIELVFVRGVPGTLEDLGIFSKQQNNPIPASRSGAAEATTERTAGNAAGHANENRKPDEAAVPPPVRTTDEQSEAKAQIGKVGGQEKEQDESDEDDDNSLEDEEEDYDENEEHEEEDDDDEADAAKKHAEIKIPQEDTAAREPQLEPPRTAQTSSQAQQQPQGKPEDSEDDDDHSPEIIAMLKQAEELRTKAELALKELEKRKQEERERKLLETKRKEEEAARERKEREEREKEMREMCVVAAKAQRDATLEETILKALSDETTLRKIANLVAERIRQIEQ